MRRRPVPLTHHLPIIVALFLLLAACGGAPPGSGSSAPANAGRSEGVKSTDSIRQAAPTAGAPAATVAEAPTAASAPPAGAPAQPAEANQAQPGVVLPSDQKIIRTGKIDLVVADINQSLRTIGTIMGGAGGYIQQSATKEQGTSATAELVLRVPVDQFERVFQQLRDLAVPGRRPIESSEAQDVTEEFADTQARITNLKATEAQLLRLMAKAEKMDDILVVQRELTGIREQIERLQGRLNVIERRAAFSTIAVVLRPQPELRRPNVPVAQSPAVGAVGLATRPTFQWAVSETATNYAIQVTTEVDTTFDKPLISLDKLTATTLEWPAEQEELRLGTVYRWRIRANNATGDSDWSPSRTFTTLQGWNPLRTIGESWAASLLLLQRLTDVVLRVVVYFWWLWPLVLLMGLGVRTLNRRRRVARGEYRPGPTPPPANPPTSSGPPSHP